MKSNFYKEEIQIPHSAGFCKNCFRDRRHGSAYCGKCQDEPERMKVYWSNTMNFPLLNKVIKHFNLSALDLNNIIFTYGDTFFSKERLSPGLIAHEITHVFQQLKMGKDEWWEKYLKDDKFRLKQEVEAYRQQYRSYKNIGEEKGATMLEKLSQDLSGKMYGNIVTLKKARELISSPAIDKTI